MKDKLVITIDGPSGVGKSTVSKILADRLSYVYLDTGGLYRAVAFKLLAAKITTTDEKTLEAFLRKVTIDFRKHGADIRIFVDGEDVSDSIRTEEIGLTASTVSALPVVREALLSVQRSVGAGGGIVAEGRDMGTVVFPNADVKFFLDASSNERVKRRYNELRDRGDVVDYSELAEGMAVRDNQDRHRALSPLHAHPDALIIDCTDMSANEVVDKMMIVVDERRRLPDG
ncbi:MAG: Cytidylate kinase [Syntrophus sp. SKADARSKE-3]|nr:Cytidylate kinase [Syntrophus sp. SKADARSKE-3]